MGDFTIFVLVVLAITAAGLAAPLIPHLIAWWRHRREPQGQPRR